MKLTLKIKLLPTDEQSQLLLETIKECNVVCNYISEVAWERKIFNKFKIQKEIYRPFKANFNLSSQSLIRCISKVSDAYKLDKKSKRTFRPLGSIAYDCRIMSYKPNNIVSLWCLGGRQNIEFIGTYIQYGTGLNDFLGIYRKVIFFGGASLCG